MDDEANVARTDPSRVLMSDILKGQVPDDLTPEQEVEAMAQRYVLVILGRQVGGTSSPMIGTLIGFMFQDDQMEIEARVMLDDSLDVIKGSAMTLDGVKMSFEFVELHDNENVIRFETPNGFKLAGARLATVDYSRRMCSLLLNLKAKA